MDVMQSYRSSWSLPEDNVLLGRCAPCGRFAGLGSAYAINGGQPVAVNGGMLRLGSYGEVVNLGAVDTGSAFIKSWAVYGAVGAGVVAFLQRKKRMPAGERFGSALALGAALGAVPAFLVGLPGTPVSA